MGSTILRMSRSVSRKNLIGPITLIFFIVLVVSLFRVAFWIEDKAKDSCRSSCHPYQSYFRDLGDSGCACAGPEGKVLTKEEWCADSCRPYAYRFGDRCECFDPVAKEFRAKL